VDPLPTYQFLEPSTPYFLPWRASRSGLASIHLTEYHVMVWQVSTW